MRLLRPDLHGIDWGVLVIAWLSALLIFRLHLSILRTLAMAVAVGRVWSLVARMT